jgi:hypothetical protein
MKTANTLWRLAGGLSLGVTVAVTGALAMPAAAAVAAEATVSVEAGLALDKLILRNGKIIEGEILSENSTEVRFNVMVAGISAPATFKKSQIIEIIRGDADPAPAADTDDRADSSIGMDTKSEAPLISASTDAPRVCVINLKGEFGKAISPTPVREAVQAARKEEPDFLIVHLDNVWQFQGQDAPDELQGNFDWFTVADKIEPIFTKEIELEWEKQPHVVFWVGNAMGGAAFLPFLADEIYMEPDGRIGGIGTLEQMFEGVGDEVVRQKQRSLRLARAQGLAIANGYDYRLINALAQRSYVLSFNVDSGEMFERMPESTNEELLTDDGKDDRIDTMNQLVRGTGNDVLTIKADVARRLGLSSGTAADLDELLELLGILRNHEMVEGRSDQILETWAKNAANGQRQVRNLYREVNEVQVAGTPREMRRALSSQISLLERIQGLFRKYGESFDPFGDGIGNITDLETQIEQIRLRILLLRG